MKRAIVALAAVVLLGPAPVVASSAAGCAPASVDIGDVAQVEGTGTTTVFRFPVTITQAPGCQAQGSVRFHTADGSPKDKDPAKAGSDYAATTGALKWPGPETQYIDVKVAGDKIPERTEVFWVHLDNPVGLYISHSSAAGWIGDDDSRAKASAQPACDPIDCVGTTTDSGVCWIPQSMKINVDFHFSYANGPRSVRVTTLGDADGWIPVKDLLITAKGDETRATVEIQLTADRPMQIPIQFSDLPEGVTAGNMSTVVTVLTQ
jgi:Calx-beta domain-containing protein